VNRRRPLWLLGLLALVAGAALVIERWRAPVTAPERARVLPLAAEHVTAIRVRAGTRELRAARDAGGWRVEAPAAAGPQGPAAVAALVDALARLVPLDTIGRRRQRREFGLDPARVQVELWTARDAAPVVLLLGDYAPTGGSVYAALAADGAIHRVGSVIDSEIDRAFYLSRPPGESER
jgi:hypothetical protein